MNSSHRLSHSSRYTSPPPPPLLTPLPLQTWTGMEEKQMKEKHIKKERNKEERVSLKRQKIRSVKTAILWSIVFITRAFQVDEKKRRQLNIKEATQKWTYRFPLDSNDAPREAGLVSRPSLGPISE